MNIYYPLQKEINSKNVLIGLGIGLLELTRGLKGDVNSVNNNILYNTLHHRFVCTIVHRAVVYLRLLSWQQLR